MAVRKINYKDKSPLQTKPEIPEENKVNAEDLNQIKEVVNNNADEIELRQLKEEGKGLSKNDFTDELKAKLESLNNYNDTEIKKEISEINKKVAENTGNDIKQDNEIATLKNNYTNLQEQNTKLEEKIKKDRENMINLEVEGQSIHIEDSSDLEGKLEVLGNVEQETREGYNILENILTDKTVNGITVKINKDKSITLNGTATENTSLGITKNFTITEQSVFSGMCDGYGYNKMIVQIQGTDYNVNITNATPQVLQPKDNVKARIYIYAGTSITNALIKPQINKGTVAKPYEPYGASPSPEYPSEIRAVGDNINLLENTAKTQTVNGVTFTVNADGTVIANGTATSLAQISLVANLKLSAGTYTIKDAKAYAESEDFNGWFDGLNNPFTQTFNTEVLLKNVYIQVKQGETVNNKIFYPKLENGTVATSYSKFGQGSVEIRKQNENFFNKNNANILNAYIGVSKGNIVSGTYHRTVYLKVNKGTYTITKHKGVPGFVLGHTKTEPKLGDIVENLVNAVGKTVETISVENGYLVINIFVTSDYNANYTLEDIFNGLKVELGKVSTEYTEHKEETKILPIQKPMLEGDYFVKEADGWKEVHKLEKKIFNGTERFGNIENIGSVKYFTCFEVLNTYKYLGDNTANYISNCFKNIPVSQRYRNNTFFINSGKNPIFSSNSFSTTEEFKAKLVELYNANNPMYIHYELATPIKLPCTPEQTKILDELDNFQTYKPVTNITTDSIAKLKLKYIADTKTYVDNAVNNKVNNLEQQVSVINQLLSTTKTSSVLLDNLQFDIEREVL